ncbi:MAG TPA: hypothetical protein VGE30_03905 [Candidatus Saccharimonadales bacterium]
MNTKHTLRTVVLMIVVGVLSAMMAYVAPAATAAPKASASEQASSSTTDEPASCEGKDVTAGTGECADVDASESHSKSSSESKAVAVNGVKLTSKVTVLANIRANGTPKAQQTDCYRIPRAMSLWTSYNAEGTTGWHWKSYPKGYRFCRINGAVRDPNCHNMVKIGVPKSRPPKNAIYGKVKFVKRLKWEAAAVAKADEKTVAVAKAWCNSVGSYAYGEGKGSAAAYAVGRARMRGFVLSKLLADVEARAQGDLQAQLGGKSVIQVRGEVRSSAFAKATSEARAIAICKDVPAENKPPTGEIVQFPQHLYPGGEYRAKVVGSDNEDGGNVTLTVSVTGAASIITDANHPVHEDIEGTNKVRYFWIKAGNTPGNFTITLTVTDRSGKTFTTSITKPVVADEF